MPNITFYAPRHLAERLRQRGLGNGENVVARDLERYYELLHVASQHVRDRLQDVEFQFLCDALQGLELPRELLPHLHQVVLGAVEEARVQGLHTRWGVDVQALQDKLKAMTRRELLALVDEVEQYWQARR